MKEVKIACPGALAEYLVVTGRSSAGKVTDGIAVHWSGCPKGFEHKVYQGCFVLSWDDFERAYLALKADREQASETGGEAKP